MYGLTIRCVVHVLQAYPLDLVRTRLAVQTQGSYYHGILPTLQRIVADEGAVGLYRGLGATLLQVRTGYTDTVHPCNKSSVGIPLAVTQSKAW
jgi:hypothetical protein